MKKLVSASLLLLLLYPALIAQKAPMKFGKVSEEDVAMEFYEPDSTVDAAVLCEYGSFDPYKLSFSYMVRYKIFSKEGLNSLIMSIPVQSKSMVNGIVFNMVDGKVVKSKMGKEDIYEERVSGSYSRMRIAPPDAKAGSVIDIKYSYRGLPGEWHFQKRIPVLWSELHIPPSQNYSFNKRFIGYTPMKIVTDERWAGENIPAFLPEPYISSEKNFMTTMFIEVSEVQFSGGNGGTGYHKQFSNTWKDVADYYYDNERHGEILRGSASYLNEAADSVRLRSEGELELVVNALAQIRKDVKWNKRQGLYPSSSLREVYAKDKTGNSSDMNFLFLKLLEKLDVECYPMVMSTRSEGLVNPHFPSRSRFNYTVSHVKIGEEFHVIDAAEKYYPYDLLNRQCLNNSGFEVTQDGGKWIDIVPQKSSKQMINCSLSIGEDGLMEGSMLVMYADYAVALFREGQDAYTTQDEYLEEFEQDHPGIYVMDYKVEGLEQEFSSITETFSVEIDGNANVSGGMIYLDPIIMGGVDENPFKLEERLYPVDFGYGRSKMFNLNLTIPEGYVAEQLPAPIRLVTTDKSGVFMYNVAQNGNVIQVMYQMSTTKPLYLESEYAELRYFFDIIVNKESEPIVLRRAEP